MTMGAILDNPGEIDKAKKSILDKIIDNEVSRDYFVSSLTVCSIVIVFGGIYITCGLLSNWNFGLAALVIYALETYRRNRPDPKKQKFAGPIRLPGIGCLFQGLVVKLRTIGESNEIKGYELVRTFGKDGTAEGIGGMQNFLITKSFEVAKEVLNSPDAAARFPSHPRFHEHTFYKFLGLIFNAGDSWKETRKFTIKTLKDFGFGELKSSEGFLQEELADFIDKIDVDRNKNTKNEVYVHEYFKIPVMNILWRVMAGYRFKYDDPDILRLINYIDKAAEIEIGMDLEWAYPFLRYLPFMSNSRVYGDRIKDCQDFFWGMLKERRQLGQYKVNQVTYMDSFLKKIDDEKGNPNTFYTDENFVISCLDLLYGGLDTTASALEYAILFMVKHQNIQAKVQAEIDHVIGRDRIPTVFDRASLPYCTATLLEALRFANPIPCNTRSTLCDTYICGKFVPKDTFIGMLNSYIHMDPNIFEDPQTFRPERFLDANMNIINEDKLLVFGTGKRHCLGYTMGKVMLATFFIRIMQRYSLKPSPDHPTLSIEPHFAIANAPKPFHCIIKLRDEQQV